MRKSILLLILSIVAVLGKRRSKHAQGFRFDAATLFEADQQKIDALLKNGTQILTEMLRDPFYQDFVRGVASQGKLVIRMINITEVREAVDETAMQIFNFTEQAIEKVIGHLEKMIASQTPFMVANEALYDLEIYLESEIYKIMDNVTSRIERVKAAHLGRLSEEQMQTLYTLLEMLGLYQQTAVKVISKGINNAQFFMKTINFISELRDEKRLQALETELRAFVNSVLPTLKAVKLDSIKNIVNTKIDHIFAHLTVSLNKTATFLEKLELEAEPGVTLAQVIDASHGSLVQQMFDFRNQANLELKDMLGRVFSFLRIEGVDSLHALQVSRRIFSLLQVESQKISDIIIEGIMLQELRLIYGDEVLV